MSLADQRELLAAAFEHRLQKTANLSYESSVFVRVQNRTNGKLGKVIWPGGRTDFQRHRLGESYRVDTKQFGEDLEAKSKPPLIQSGFNADEGVSRVRVQQPSGKITARIDTKQDIVIVHDRYSYWLTGADVPDSEFLFTYLLKDKDDWTLTTENEPSLVKLSVPWKPLHSRNRAIGDKHVWLDPARGYMPVRGEARWEDDNGWRSEEFSVDETQQFDGLWMPTKITEIIGSSSFGDAMPSAVNVIETTAQNIEMGAVTEADVRVVFPEGTEVVDAIEGVAYTIGEGNVRLGGEPLFVGNQIVNISQAPKSTPFPWLIVLNTAIVISVVVFWLKARRKQTSLPQ
ncbi:hypothetical protein [Fuerstiella marisgermanici]|uniref:hypothetical protein n=1 Tax=Fuerstiella marisgermanici TaxID=1891926 RepID=UPI0011AB5C2A|nr:hypothetical protein [Fuerstiella marisgermanici]